MSRPSGADPHAGHRMLQGNGQTAPVNKPAPDSAPTPGGHRTPANKAPNPHAGHVSPPAAPDVPARHGDKEKK
ncbi:hypothetical protein LP420_38350 [Massilia sp. B-10]|nr:hypothetical protein LP420_38350 [Massilia sp. B-10]UUZ54122.1 hypothetical protein LP419_37805 [Massilia sp. H-1]